ncbi:MAG: pilus assembly protein PilP [Thiotrichaceae bacterium]|nr:pilus assembly protein PilP [Thiotrichaceae bacterium]
MIIPHKISVIFKSLALLVVLGTLSACNEEKHQELESYLTHVKNRSGQPITPIPVIKPYLRFIYPEHEVDPFDITVLTPIIDTGEEVTNDEKPKGIVLDKTRVPEFLESFPLTSLRMVGTINKKGELWALVKTSKGGIQRVRAGNYLGEDYGKITLISDSKISVSEIIPNGYGGYKAQETAINLFAD